MLAVADEINELDGRGLEHVVSADVLRLFTASALQRQGVEGKRLRVGQRYPMGTLGPDPAVDTPPTASVVIMCSRNSHEGPDAGELLGDLRRLAGVDAPEAWAVQLIGSVSIADEVLLAGVGWSPSPGHVIELDPPAGVPPPWATHESLRHRRPAARIVVRCEGIYPAGGRSLFVYRRLPGDGSMVPAKR
jgi:hypothetical protein